jgi:DNA-directed RNA polymerase specialized sigma24 family protein
MIDLARAGDAETKLKLWERYRNLLYAMARDVSDDDDRSGAADTSDVVAEAAARYFGANLFRDIQDRRHFLSLLRRIVHGKAIDLHRREVVRPKDLLPEESLCAPTDPTIYEGLLVDLRDLMEALPLHLCQTAYALLEYGTERVAAEALCVTRHEVRNRLAQIRKIWARELGDE